MRPRQIPAVDTSGFATASALTSGLAGKQDTLAARAYSYPTRALNTAVQLSTTRQAEVFYSVDVQIQSLLLGSAQGTVFLEYADDSGMTTNLVNVISGTNRTSGVLNLDNTGTVYLSGAVPAAKYVRIRTQTNAGTVVFTSRQGQEVLI